MMRQLNIKLRCTNMIQNSFKLYILKKKKKKKEKKKDYSIQPYNSKSFPSLITETVEGMVGNISVWR